MGTNPSHLQPRPHEQHLFLDNSILFQLHSFAVCDMRRVMVATDETKEKGEKKSLETSGTVAYLV